MKSQRLNHWERLRCSHGPCSRSFQWPPTSSSSHTFLYRWHLRQGTTSVSRSLGSPWLARSSSAYCRASARPVMRGHTFPCPLAERGTLLLLSFGEISEVNCYVWEATYRRTRTWMWPSALCQGYGTTCPREEQICRSARRRRCNI